MSADGASVSMGAALETVAARLADERYFEAPFGLTAVGRCEPGFDPRGYGRGASWPHLNYLMWCALERSGKSRAARRLLDRWVAGTVVSGFSEYVEPLTAEGLGARPQSWSALIVVPHSGLW